MSKKIDNNSTLGAHAPAPDVNGAYYRGKRGENKDPMIMVGVGSGSEPVLDRYFPRLLRPGDLSGLMPHAHRSIDSLALYRSIGVNALHINFEDSVSDFTLDKILAEEMSPGKISFDIERNVLEYKTLGGKWPDATGAVLSSKHMDRLPKFKIKPTTIKSKAGSPLMTALLQRLDKE